MLTNQELLQYTRITWVITVFSPGKLSIYASYKLDGEV